MRRLIALMLGLLAVAAGASAYFEHAQSQRAAWLEAAGANGIEFAIPPDTRLADPDRTYPILAAAADAAHSNVFRTAVEYGTDDRPRIVLYALLSSRTQLEREFAVASGRWLGPDDAGHPERFLSSIDTGNPDQVGRLADFGGGDDVSVRSLQSAFDSLPVAGSYVVEPSDSASADTFFRLLATGASSAIGSTGAFEDRDFRGQGQHFLGVEGDPGPLVSIVQLMIVLATALLIAFRVLHRARAVGVMRLQGLGPIAVWYRLIGRLITTVALLSAAVVGSASLLVPNSTVAFAAEVVSSMTRAFAVMLVASGVASAALLLSRASDSIKNRKPTRALFALNALVKTTFTLALIAAGAGLWLQYQLATGERAQLGSWDRARDYAIFYPVSNGNDQLDMESGQEGYSPAVVEDLYPVLDARGALYIDATGFDALEQSLPPGAFRSVTVNLNYLRRFPVIGEDGQPIEISNSTTDWVVLAPVSLRSRAAEIEDWFQRAQEGKRVAERAFGGSVPDAITKQGVSIRWVANDQDIFSFNPVVNSDAGNTIRDPIIEVMTAANSVGMDRANAITGDAEAALKVPLRGADTTALLTSLQPDLRSLKLDDNLRHLVTLDGYVSLEVARIENTMGAIIVAGGVLLAGLFYLSAASVAVLAERYSRRVVVHRLHGAGFVRRYRETILIFSGVWLGQLVGALGLNRLGANPFSAAGAGRVADDRLIFALAVAVGLLEAVMSATVLMLIERRGVARVLKEEF